MHFAMLALLPALIAATQAAPHKPRFGFQHFDAALDGGYSLVTPAGTVAGPAFIRIHAPPNGRSARVAWRNTFYNEHGGHNITMRWNFRTDGVFTANTIDPRVQNAPAIGAFTLVRNHPIPFTATSGGITAKGLLRLSGGGSITISVTLTGLPEGEVTYSFSGGRIR